MSSENPSGKSLPKLEGATLALHWADFKRLLERRAAVLPAKDEPQPPVPFVLGEAVVDGEVHLAGEAPSAAFSATFDLNVLADAWVRVPLLDGTLGLSAAKLDGADLPIDPDDTNPLSALVRGPGSHRVSLTFATPLLTDADQSGFELSVPAAPVVRLSVRIPRTGLDATVDPAVQTAVAEEQGATRVEAAIPSGQTVRVSWTKQAEKVEETAPEPPQVFARTETFVALGDGISKAVALVAYNVLRSPLSRVAIEVPADATVADVRGGPVGSWEVRAQGKNKPQLVEVELRSECKGAFQIALELDRPWDEKPPIALPLTRAVGAERENGFVAVAAMTALEITPADTKGLARVDVKELPPALAGRLPFPVVLAYKFREAGGTASVTVQRHADLPVVTAMADTAEHTVLQTADGKRVWRSNWRVRNAQRQFVRVKLPDSGKIWSTLLDGEPVKPAADDEAGTVLVPLKKAQNVAETERPFSVEIVAMAEPGPLGEKGSLRIALPTCDLPIGALRCSIWLPDHFLYDDFSGSLEEVKGFRDPWASEGTVSQAMRHVTPKPAAPLAPPPPPAPAAPPPPPMAQAAFSGGPGAGMMAPSPAPAPASLAAPKPVRAMEAAKRKSVAAHGERERQGAARDEDAYAAEKMDVGDLAPMEPEPVFEAPRDIGVLPVRMAVPEKGLCFAFEKLLVLDEPLFVETEYAKEKVARD